MIANWLKWHFLHIRLFFSNKGKTADNEIKTKTVNAESMRAHNPTDNEASVAREYAILSDDFGAIKRMNGYFWLFLVLYAVGYGLWHAIGAPATYTESRGVKCPPDSGFWECLGVYIEKYINFPLLLLMGLIIGLLVTLGWYEWIRGRGERVTETEYQEGKKWLHLVAEDSRKLIPWYWLPVLGVGLLIEAAAISIIASSYISDLSRNVEIIVGSVIGLVVAAVLAMLVHNAGAAIYRNQKRPKLEFAIDREKNMREFTALKSDFSIDEPSITKRFGLLVLSISIILALSVFAYQQRYQLNMDIIEGELQTPLQDDFFKNDSFSDPDENLPQDLLDKQNKTQDEYAKNSIDRQEKGLTSALILLATIFVLINLLGVMIGHKYSLLNDKSEKSYKDIAEYKRWKKSDAQQNEERRKVHAEANKYFSKYHECLRKAANKRKDHDEEYNAVAQALETRGAFNMKDYQLDSNEKNA